MLTWYIVGYLAIGAALAWLLGWLTDEATTITDYAITALLWPLAVVCLVVLAIVFLPLSMLFAWWLRRQDRK